MSPALSTEVFGLICRTLRATQKTCRRILQRDASSHLGACKPVAPEIDLRSPSSKTLALRLEVSGSKALLRVFTLSSWLPLPQISAFASHSPGS